MKKMTLSCIYCFSILCFASSILLTHLNDSISPVYASSEATDSFQEESCSVMYVGKEVSENGLPIIARTGDGKNSLIYHHVRRYEKDEFAKKEYKGANGFSWNMPEHTYAFTGFPRCSSVGKTLHWDVSTMNECGLAVSATLSCSSDNERVLKFDPFVATGISEDNIAGIIASTSSTAKEGMEFLASVIDQNGSAEANIVMALDQNEAWLMEIYSGHQYCAIKLPDNKVTTIGNEFFLNTLSSFSDENIIASQNLFSLPKENGFAVFEGGEENKNMHLFYTYARPLTCKDENEAITVDASHMRTWRGRDLFAKEDEKLDYQTSLKYESFFSPSHKLSINDCFTYFRDCYQNLLDNPDAKYNLFRLRKEQGRLRSVAVETSYQVHVIMSHNDLPKEMAVEAWISMGNAYSAPFVPFNNSMTIFPEEYVHEVNSYGPDEMSAQYIFRSISSLVNIHKQIYGMPTQKAWNIFEDIWKQQYNSCLNKAYELIKENKNYDAKNLLNNYLFDVQTKAISEAKFMYKDLLSHYMMEQKTYKEDITDFVPKTDIISFAELYDYKYEIKDKTITLTNGDRIVTINYDGLSSFVDGKIKCEGNEANFKMHIDEGKYYGDIQLLNRYLANGKSLKEPNYDELLHRGQPNLTLLYVLLPVSLVVVVASVTLIVLVKRKKKNNATY